MNLYEKLAQNEVDLIKEAGVNIGNQEYSKEDLEKCEYQIIEYIMTASSKNEDIERLRTKHDEIFRKINK